MPRQLACVLQPLVVLLGMNQIDHLNYNMNIKLSKETHFLHTQEAGPQHTETALGVFPKGIVAPSWSELSVERGSCPDGPGCQPAAEISSIGAKGKCLSLQVTGPSPPSPMSPHFLGLIHSDSVSDSLGVPLPTAS